MPQSPPADPRDALIGEQGAQIAALTALVAELREQLAAALRAVSRNSGNSSVPPSGDDLPGRRPPVRKERRAAERAERKRNRGKQPGSPGAAMCWREPDEVVAHFPGGACACGLDLHRARCACGQVHVAGRPAGVPASPLPAPAERGVRPLKTQQKISGRLTSDHTTQDRLDIRSYLDTAVKHGLSALDLSTRPCSETPGSRQPSPHHRKAVRNHAVSYTQISG